MTRVMTDSLGEGGTPVLELHRLARHYGVPSIAVKAEWLNPTGSYKDRIARETIRDAVARGSRGWIGTSSGNGGAAMAAYGARAGLPGFLCISADAPREKLLSIVPYGVTMIPMSGLGIREMDAIGVLADTYGLKLAVTAYRYNPEGMAGAEMIGVELAGDEPVTHVYVPTGGGGLLAAIDRGLVRADHGSTAVVCAQPEGCGPIARYVEGELDAPDIAACATTISGLQLAHPPDGDLASAAVTRSGGWGCLVADEVALEAQALLASEEGIFVEPASALAVAALVDDYHRGRLDEGARPIAVLTGSGLKDLSRLTFADTGRIFTIDELEHVMKEHVEHD